MDIGLIVECIVALLLVVTICYCWVLNKRLKRLRSDEESLRATISELITATEIAERAILGLKSTAGNADRTLGARLDEAENVSRKLTDQLDFGQGVLDRIGNVAHGAASAEAASPRREPVAEPARQPKRNLTDDIRRAAGESASRLEEFRRRSQERVA
ncbi:chemotaxis protein [Rhodobacteraceae bacterium RKSG542]|uniref:DUF6468 domain-containing protein n=1 Tax=Pseudovibrio flavus TaxID=2529854 RepID=UPI0012BD361F|nr:DUF6468 domain-containing protein [Pseudovibrio flavus]MTI19276.1 chemotaxis protein [Pseudovibrio flavus]